MRISNEPDDPVSNYTFDETFVENKKPSYLNISCSISGYSDYSHYHRSHPNTGAKYLSRSRDSSPMPGSKMLTTLNYNLGSFIESKTRISEDEPDLINGKHDVETKEFISYDDGDRLTETSEKMYFVSKHKLSVVSELKKAAETVQNGSHCKNSSYKSQDVHSDIVSESKSIVKQRIERLTAHTADVNDVRRFDVAPISHASINKGKFHPVYHIFRDLAGQLSKAYLGLCYCSREPNKRVQIIVQGRNFLEIK